MRVLLFSLLIILLSACGNGPSIVFVTTAQPELAPYLELYNGSQDDFKVVLNYSADPASDATAKGIIIDSHLSSLENVKQYKSCSSLFKGEENPEGLDSLMFYSELLFKGYYDNQQYFLPLSFTVPTIMSKNGETETPALEYEDMLSPEFASKKNNKFNKIGFDIFWEPHFTYDLFKSMGVKPAQGAGGVPRLQAEPIDAFYKRINEFKSNRPYTEEEEIDFRSRYFAYPAPKLILQDNIKYYPFGLNEFVKLPLNMQEQLQLSFFVAENKITVHEDVLYIGIKGEGEIQNGERHFLNWLLTPETQARIIETHDEKAINSFGFVGGFSSISSINTGSILKKYSFLPENLFEGYLLAFPEIMPPEWPAMRESVLPEILKAEYLSAEDITQKLIRFND